MELHKIPLMAALIEERKEVLELIAAFESSAIEVTVKCNGTMIISTSTGANKFFHETTEYISTIKENLTHQLGSIEEAIKEIQ